MTNALIVIKIKDRVNKTDSSDYGNIQPYQFLEAFNKSMDAWVRRQLEGINQTKTGNEGSTRRIDDLQCILTIWTGGFTDKGLYWQSDSFPSDYLEWCRVSASAQDTCKECGSRPLVLFEGNEADVDIYLADENRQPDYYWGTSFSTLMGNRFKIWTNDQFDIVDPSVTYYRAPKHIQILGETNPDTGTVSSIEVTCEFPDGVTELMIDEAAAILSGDMDALQKMQQLSQSAETNN